MPYKKMNKKFKAKWIKALLSKRYKQGTEVLHLAAPSGDKFCCLGVACKVARLPQYNRHMLTQRRPVQYMSSPRSYDGDSSMLPRGFAERVGLSLKVQRRLAGYNDESRWDFARIAAWIKKNL